MQAYQISIRDLWVIREVARGGSVREAARRLDMPPGAVSRITKAVEQRTELGLFERSQSGMVTTPAGKQFLVEVGRFLDGYESLLGRDEPMESWLTVGSYSYLSNALVSRLPGESWVRKLGLRFRLLDVAPDQLIVAGLRGLFQVAVHMGARDWPKTWVAENVGDVTWNLCVRRRHPLGDTISESELEDVDFITPIGWDMTGIFEGDDFCPMRRTKRRVVHQVATADLALHTVAHSDNVAYVPNIVVAGWAKRLGVRTVAVKEWPQVTRPLFVAAKAEMVAASTYKNILKSISASLAAAPMP